MAYYMLYTRDTATDPWAPQFGDKDRECVRYEAGDMVEAHKMGLCGHKRTDTKIVKFPRVPTRGQVEAKTATLNATGAAREASRAGAGQGTGQ